MKIRNGVKWKEFKKDIMRSNNLWCIAQQTHV